jgi:dynein heavy chain 2
MESQLDSYANTDMSGGDAASNVLELKCKALILDTIHAIDVVEKLVKNNVRSTEDWLWQKQLRFYMAKGNNFSLYLEVLLSGASSDLLSCFIKYQLN